MRVAITIFLITIFLISLAYAGAFLDPYDYPIVKLYEKATTHSKEIYKIPVEIKLLDINEELTWFKIKIGFSLGPVKFNYVGWTHLPIEKLILEKVE